jgi:2-dehydro-3-deoxyphosphogluconate aldolase/(4S)-4-hydroxy-2-oxoglutarate aldolase
MLNPDGHANGRVRERLSPSEILDISPVIPVVVHGKHDEVVRAAEALLRGGVGVVEVTLRFEGALAAITTIATELPEIVVGAGTINSVEQALSAMDAGAQFLVSPGAPRTLLDAAVDGNLPLIAGASTATEVMTLLEAGLTAMKFFPAVPSGGRQFLEFISAPLPDARFCPTGGISAQNAGAYLALDNVGCVGGSWMTSPQLLAEGDWAQVEHLARRSTGLRRAMPAPPGGPGAETDLAEGGSTDGR